MRRNRISVGLLIATALVVGALPMSVSAQNSTQNGSARVLFLQGRDLWDEGRFADAERKFREALSKYPKAEQADRTAFYLITTLMKQGRAKDAQAETENFRRTYPQSEWSADVEEMRLALIGRVVQLEFAPFQNPRIAVPAPPPQPVPPPQSPLPLVHAFNDWNGRIIWASGNSSLESEILRLILEKDPERGINIAEERLKSDPSDPAVVSNLSTISKSGSSLSLPFLMNLAGNSTVPNVRSQAIFWVGQIQDPKVLAFLTDAARNDKDLAVRRAAVQALASRKDADVRTLEDLLKSLPAPAKK